MDILSQSNNQSNFSKKIYSNDDGNIVKAKEPIFDGNKNDGNVFRLNPLLNESLNNLVKRLERTKIPKPPPTKGQSIRKKSKLTNSLPNIFLPPGFDDHKYSNNEKKVQWSNKLNLNLERLKNAFHETYTAWCEKKRSQSVSNLERISHNIAPFTVSESCPNDLEPLGDITKIVQDNVSGKQWELSNAGKLEQPPKIVTTSELEDIPSYSTHVYLDGAIIEPISPASPARMQDTDSINDQIAQDLMPPDIQSDTNYIKPVIRKKGRPKKIKQPLVTVKAQELSIEEVVSKPTKVPATKKRNKSQKTKSKDEEMPSFSSDITDDSNENTFATQKPSLTKRQKKLASSQLESSSVSIEDLVESISADNNVVDKSIEKSPLLKKNGRKNSKQNKVMKSKNQNVNLSEDVILPENVPQQLSTKKSRRTGKFAATNVEEITPVKEDSTLEIEASLNVSEQLPNKVDESGKSNIDEVQESCNSEITDKPSLTKKQRKSSKQILPELVTPTVNTDVIDEPNLNPKSNKMVETPTLTKKQKQLLKKTTPNKDIDAAAVETNGKEKIIENIIASNKDVGNPEPLPLDEVIEQESKTRKTRKFTNQSNSVALSQENEEVKDLIEESNQLLNINKDIAFSIEAHLSSDVEVPGEMVNSETNAKNIEKEPRTKSPRKLSRQNQSVEVFAKEVDHFDLCIDDHDDFVLLKPEESILMKMQNELVGSLELKTYSDHMNLNIEVPESEKEKPVVTKLNKRGTKKSTKTKLTQDDSKLPEIDKNVDTGNYLGDFQAENDLNSASNNIVEEELIPIDKRRRLQRKNQKPVVDVIIHDVDVVEEPQKNIMSEVPKKGAKVKIGPKSKKQLFKVDEYVPQLEIVEQSIPESVPAEKSKISPKPVKKGRLKSSISDEHCDLDVKNDSTDVPIVVVIPDKEVVDKVVEDGSVSNKVAESDVLKSDPPPILDQSNDLEMLSKSITDSVDTSMLPPRKRYKRLMYLDNTKPASPKETEVVESTEIVEEVKVNDQENVIKDDEEVPTKKVSNFRSRLKRKKPIKADEVMETSSTDDAPIEIPATITEQAKDEVMPEKDDIVPIITEEMIDKPSSLKRSKREAAARGFANMVAMSLNNSSQSHDTSSDFTKKSVTITDETTTDVSSSKMFKKPRKTTLASIGLPKNKGKLSRSFEFSDEIDDDMEEFDASKLLTKKQRMSKEKSVYLKENPPSPGDTIVSNDSSGQDVSKYRKIRTNVYGELKPGPEFLRVEKCYCKPSTVKDLYSKNEDQSSEMHVLDCSDECLNRLTFMECNSKTCPCGQLCKNQKIRKLEWVPSLKVIDIATKGRGVISTKAIVAGTFIIEYVGEVISEKTFQARLVDIYKDDPHHYCLHIDGDMVIDAYRCGSVARFVNHSCQPNCDMQKWLVNGCYRMGLFANEDIDAETELTFDYNFCSYFTKTAQICVCGAPSCRGFIGGRLRLEQFEKEKDRKKLLFAFGRIMPKREKLFIVQKSIFLFRDWVFGRCKRLGLRRTKLSYGLRLPSTISEIKRRSVSKDNEFLTQMSTLNSIRTIRGSLLENGGDKSIQLGWILRDLYNGLLEQKDPLNQCRQLVAPFINGLRPSKYPEFYSMVGQDSVVCLNQVYWRLLNGKYSTMMSFDQDILQMIQNVELYAGKQSNIGKCAEQMKPAYKDLKMNAIALYETLTEEVVDDREKNKLLSNNLTQITNAVKSLSNSNAEVDQNDSSGPSKNKKRKQGSVASVGGSRGRLERGAEVIKCVCGFLIEAGHVMVQCDHCFVWQHAYCMNVARSSDLVDVTRIEPYYCHICLDIPTESLIREIPRHFVITDETVDSGNTLFWTLLHPDMSLLKIDDFVYIPSDDRSESEKETMSQRTIMRIYSLWKDCGGQRWMEGGLFLRPYNGYLKSLSESRAASCDSTNKRKASTVMNLSTHKWHQQEVVYTDLTKILPLDVCVGRCHVLNTHTFRLGKPIMQNDAVVGIEDVYLCDWLINKTGDWSEIDPSYMKINTKPYCFERYTDAGNAENGVETKFLRQYTTEELLKFDQRVMETGVNKIVKMKPEISTEEKSQKFEKLVSKLSEFAYDRNRKLHVSAPSQNASPVHEISSSVVQISNHRPRKQSIPKKTPTSIENIQGSSSNRCCSDDSKRKTIASEYSEGSPKLMIIVEDEKIVLKSPEECSPIDDKSSDIVSSSTKDNFEERSNPCSEIKYGDLLDLLKETVSCKPKPKPKSKAAKGGQTKGKKKPILKKNVLKPVSEINSVDDNWIPCGSLLDNNAPRRETRSRKTTTIEEKILSQESNLTTMLDVNVPVEEIEEDARKTCFVKLERMRVSRAEKNRLKKAEHDQNSSETLPEATNLISGVASTSSDKKLDSQMSLEKSKFENVFQQAIQSDGVQGTDNDSQNPNSSSAAANNRSKRKKGVPKRIPFDFPYQPVGNVPKQNESGSSLTYDYEVVDLSAGKTGNIDKPEQIVTESQKIDLPELVATSLPKLPKPSTTATETRHITAANDFSSIENISSN